MRVSAIRTAAAVLSLAALACQGKQEETQATPTPTSTSTTTAPTTSTSTATTTSPTPTPTPTTATTTATNAPTAASTASAHAKVGPDKCKACHRVEYDSWAASKHPSKGLDCEGCHGNGADYRSPAVMRDPAKAAAAGLVKPGVSLCRRCHRDASAALLPGAHAHKVR